MYDILLIHMLFLIFAVLRDDFRLMPVDTRVASGDTAILKCIPPRGNPKPRLIWLKNGQPLGSIHILRKHF